MQRHARSFLRRRICRGCYPAWRCTAEIAYDTEYGLAAYVSGRDPAKLREIASRLHAGQVNLNNAPMDPMAPFGGYKTSGNGREWGDYAFAEFLETKAILGVT